MHATSHLPIHILTDTSFPPDLILTSLKHDDEEEDLEDEAPKLKSTLIHFIISKKLLLQYAIFSVPPSLIKDFFRSAFSSADDRALDALIYAWPLSTFNLEELCISTPSQDPAEAPNFIRQRLKTIWGSLARSCCYNPNRQCRFFNLKLLKQNFSSLGLRFFTEVVIKNLLVILGAFDAMAYSEPQQLPVTLVTEWMLDLNHPELTGLILNKMSSSGVFKKRRQFKLQLPYLHLLLTRSSKKPKSKSSLLFAIEAAQSFLKLQRFESVQLQLSGLHEEEDLIPLKALSRLLAERIAEVSRLGLSVQIAGPGDNSLFSELCSSPSPALKSLSVHGSFSPILLKRLLSSSLSSLRELSLRINHSPVGRLGDLTDEERDKRRMLGLLTADNFVDIRHNLSSLSLGGITRLFLPTLISLLNCSFPALNQLSLKDATFPAGDFNKLARSLCFGCPRLKLFVFERTPSLENCRDDLLHFADIMELQKPQSLKVFGVSCNLDVKKGVLKQEKPRRFKVFVL